MSEATLKVSLDQSELDDLISDYEDRLRRATERANRSGGGSRGGGSDKSGIEREEENTLRLAQAQARLRAATGDLAGAENLLKEALDRVAGGTIAAANAEIQLINVQNRGQREARQAANEALSLAQARARLLATTGDLAGAERTLVDALDGNRGGQLNLLRVQQQLENVRREMRGFGDDARGASRIARESFITASSEIIESWGVDGDIANELGRMFYNLPIQAKLAIAGVIAGIGLGIAAVAAFVISINEMLETAEKVGTDSKEEFEKFSKAIKDVGGEVTTLDRKMSQELVRASEQVKAATDNLFLVLIRESGPELLTLLKNTAQFLVEMTPVARRFGAVLSEGFNIATAAIRTFQQTRGIIASALSNPSAASLGNLFGFGASVGLDFFKINLEQVRKEAEQAGEKIDEVKLKGFKASGSREQTELQKMAEQLKDINRELDVFKDTTSAEYKLKVAVDNQQELKSQIDEIVKFRRELGGDINAPFATKLDERGRKVLDAAGIKGELEYWRNLKKQIDETTKSVEKIGERLEKNQEAKLAPPPLNGLKEEIAAEAKLIEQLEQAKRELNGRTAEGNILSSKEYELTLKENPALAEKIRLGFAAVDMEKQRNKALDDLNSVTEDLNRELLGYNDLSRAQQVAVQLQEERFRGLTDAERQSAIELASHVDAVEANRRAMEEFAQTTENLFNTLFDRGPKAFFDELLSIGKRTLAKLLSEFVTFGYSANQATGQGIGGFFRNLFNGGGGGGGNAGNGGSGGGIGGFFGNLLNGGGGGAFRTPNFNPAATGSVAALAGAGGSSNFFSQLAGLNFGISVPASITGIPNRVGTASRSASAAVNGALGSSLFGGLFNGIGFGKAAGSGGALASLLPFLGVSLGSGLGGESGLGRVIGGIGGGLLGIGLTAAPAIFGAGGALASPAIAALFSNPFTAIAGAAALAAAFFIGRANQRKKDERTSGESLQRAIDELKDLRSQAQRGNLTSVAEAESAFTSIHRQFINETLQLKSGSVRQSRIDNQGDITPPLHKDSLRALFEREVLPEVVNANRRKGVFNNLIPEFDKGGVVPYTGLIFAHEREVILNLNQQRGLAALAGGDIFRRLGVPNAPTVAPAGNSTLFTRGSSGGSGPTVIELHVEVGMSKTGAGEIVANGVNTQTGENALVYVVNKSKLNKRVKG